MSIYRTAQGKPIDMSQLSAKNQKERAVSNMNVNARGDVIDSTNRVVIPASQKVGNRYQKTVANRAANLTRPEVDNLSIPTVLDEEEYTAEELEFVATDEEDAEIAKIKAQYEKQMAVEKEKLAKKEAIAQAKALQAKLAEEASAGKIKVKPASEAPDTFDPTKD